MLIGKTLFAKVGVDVSKQSRGREPNNSKGGRWSDGRFHP